MRHSERLCSKIDLALPRFIEASNDVIGHPRFRELYPELLKRLHWIIRATVPVMLVARDRCRELAETDPVAAALAPYYDEHAREEQHHDEWLLQDLELLGHPRAEVLRRIPSAVAAESVGARYYWTLHHHPLAELGAMAVAECNPMAASAVDLMQELTGYPREAFRTLAVHAELDPHHRDEILATLDALPLDDGHHELLGLAALQTVDSITRLYRELLDDFAEEPAMR